MNSKELQDIISSLPSRVTDVLKPGAQPVDPEADPMRRSTTDWVHLATVDVLDNYQYLRFRVDFAAGDPLPVVKSIAIPVSATRD